MKKIVFILAMTLNFALAVVIQSGIDAYRNGDFLVAADIWKSECEAKNADSCGMLAILYYEGKGVAQDKKMSKKYFEQSCKLGKQSACEQLKEIKF